jgi:hypothetical protein
MPGRKNAYQGYSVAEPSGFPGVKIPLLSDEDCRARGIEPGRFPPRATWTQQQRDAADKLMGIRRASKHDPRKMFDGVLRKLALVLCQKSISV